MASNTGGRNAANSSAQHSNDHRPTQPSGLRNTQLPPDSPRNSIAASSVEEVRSDGIHPHDEAVTAHSDDSTAQAQIQEPQQPNLRTKLLGQFQKYYGTHDCGEEECTHGTVSPRPRFLRGYGSWTSYGRATPEDANGRGQDDTGNSMTDGLLGHSNGPKKTLSWLINENGIPRPRIRNLEYYIPGVNWIKQYRWQYLQGDMIAALTMASFYIPMSLSYASNLGHIPPINGLYSFVFNPLLYAFLGTCPQMVVGPEAAGSLLTGSVVREAIKAGHHPDDAMMKSAQVAGMVTGLAGSIILGAGLCRLGFLDSVLSRPFLRGFISAIGIVILIDQLIPEMGLDSAASHSDGASHGSSLDKITFIFENWGKASGITCAVGFGSFAITMVLREIKRRLQPRMNWVAYVPDRFLIVVLSAVFTWQFSWDKQGLDILGDIKAQGTPFRPHFPFAADNFKHIDDAFGTALLVALLGFFESSVAAKSLGASTTKKLKADDEDEPLQIKHVQVTANRELVALGVANVLGGTFMALPAFGGYGRSKVNASTGGRTPMSSIFLSLISVICVLFLLPYFYYIPKCVLSAMISVVAWSLIEEAPHDIHYFWRISGYSELLLMFLIFLTTFFWNLRVGIASGIGLSLLRLLRHSTRPRIQILGRDPETKEFENAEMQGELEFIPHVLIVKIPEPLTFANTGSLKDRLRKLEDYGTNDAHSAQPKTPESGQKRTIIFDIHGVTAMDPAASQVLVEIVEAYIEGGTRIVFCRIPSKRTEVWRLFNVSGLIDLCGGERHFVRTVDDALKLTEREATFGPMVPGEEEEASTQPEHDPLTASFDSADDEERRTGTGR
ncbi:hypothetical protein AMS68_006666 [Peltaster fructicola]|uniref:STAS domain-containing protein n=1 Tax=Peltaster fructicola TaxID=286661 RepID=A0A6H0Y2S2_9PEZI|nr:hypothetical protein AMS68_006666 [Peltaster fructicola]